jgi:hypothetical protein
MIPRKVIIDKINDSAIYKKLGVTKRQVQLLFS